MGLAPGSRGQGGQLRGPGALVSAELTDKEAGTSGNGHRGANTQHPPQQPPDPASGFVFVPGLPITGLTHRGGCPLPWPAPSWHTSHRAGAEPMAAWLGAAPLGGWHTRFLIAHLGSGSTLLIYRMDADLGGGSRGSKSPSCDHRAGNSRWGRWATGLPCPPLVLATKGCRGLLRSQCLQSGSCRDFGHPASPCLSSWTAAHPWPAASRGHR